MERHINILEYLEAAARKTPDKPAFCDESLELCVSGSVPVSGYYGDGEKTARAFIRNPREKKTVRSVKMSCNHALLCYNL